MNTLTSPLSKILLLISLLSLSFSSAAKPIDYQRSYQVASLAKMRSTLIRNLEDYFQKHHPKDEVYSNDAHRKYVRYCAYKLAEIYTDSGKKKLARQYLTWLQNSDLILHPNAIKFAGKTYTVQSGDTLSKIAKKHDLSLAALVRFNPEADPRLLRVGQVLRLEAKP